MAVEERLARAIETLSREETDHVALRARLADILRRNIGFDVAVVATVDPTTAMWTHCLLDGMDRDEHLEHGVFRNEYCEPDVLKLADLARDRAHVGTLRRSLADPDDSPRFRDLYRPAGFDDELRLLLVDGGSAWGAVCLLRSGEPFSDDDTRAMAGIGAPVAASLRRSLLHAAAGQPHALALPPGLVVCRSDGSIEDISDEARQLLEGSGIDEVPQVVAAVRAKRAAGDRGQAALPTTDGRWIAFHATTLAGQDAVIVEQVRAHHLADLIVRVRGLTPRERDVVELVAQGASTKQIAARLFISEWTVQDHLKSVFSKFGVRTRQELIAAVFFDHYNPRHEAGDTPSPYGWYLDPSTTPAS